MPFAYILSGSLSQRSLLPGSTYPFVRWLEKKWRKVLGMFIKICLTRRFIT